MASHEICSPLLRSQCLYSHYAYYSPYPANHNTTSPIWHLECKYNCVILFSQHQPSHNPKPRLRGHRDPHGSLPGRCRSSNERFEFPDIITGKGRVPTSSCSGALTGADILTGSHSIANHNTYQSIVYNRAAAC